VKRKVALTLLSGISCIVVGAIIPAPDAVELKTPDPQLTPGAVATHDVAEICARDARGRYTYSPTHRVWHDKRGTLAKYGIPRSQGRLYEDDDRVPLCLGDDNADPRNHWPQPRKDAELKDQFEREVCIAVCDRHSMSLDDAQRLFLGDWRTAYRAINGER
jgi:hypothetical protein